MAKQYHKNPRQITAKQYEALAIDLAELGDLGGIVHDLNSDEIIGGNQRSRVFDLNACDVVLTEVLDAPDAQGTVAHGFVLWKGNKYAYRQVRWTERQAERANIVANKRGGTWDFDILADRFEQDDLLAWGFEPFELGLDEAKDAGGDTEPQIDRAEELRQLWNVQPGQLWLLGEHRLICGDCTDAATVARVMGGERVDTVITDPPYGINFDTDYTKLHGGNFGTQRRNNHPRVHGDNAEFDPSHLLDFKNIVLWGANCYPQRLTPGTFLVWDKRNAAGQTLFSDAEVGWLNRGHGCYIFSHKWDGLNRESERGEHLHPTMKPAALWAWVITEHVSDAEIIYEPYCGAGGVIIACENLSRRCRAVEISAGYVAVALQRWADHTNRTPVLLGDFP